MECLKWYFSLQQLFPLQCYSNNFSNIVICPVPTPNCFSYLTIIGMAPPAWSVCQGSKDLTAPGTFSSVSAVDIVSYLLPACLVYPSGNFILHLLHCPALTLPFYLSSWARLCCFAFRPIAQYQPDAAAAELLQRN